ncbi:MAG: arsenosugar biosynthesis radical SAM protein ArsS [Thermosynechococcaceae cyanobacterium MS004]|nr:arsenosugar biosynthesis radical SAM protein ArsS [Thermosynechococcaceae cyanobacterium MS004]
MGTAAKMNATETLLEPFAKALGQPLTKQSIRTLQINLGKRCNLACTHCHVESSPQRTEELSPQVCEQLIQVIERFPQIQVVDLTGGAPEMNYGFRPLVEAASQAGKTIMVRSNLTIFWEAGFEDLPDYFAQHQVQVVASLPCYLEHNVDAMRGKGVFDQSVRALQWLNRLGYGHNPNLGLDLVYNPPIPSSANFSLTPDQAQLEAAYKEHLQKHFGIRFNRLLTITNLPIGRTKFQLDHRQLSQSYLQFLVQHYNASTVDSLMCRTELSVDYRGFIYDCDFNQMEDRLAKTPQGEPLTVAHLLALNSLDIIHTVQTANYCYGCTAGAGSSCGGALV